MGRLPNGLGSPAIRPLVFRVVMGLSITCALTAPVSAQVWSDLMPGAGLAVENDPAGNVYVAGTQNMWVVRKYHPDGTVAWTYTTGSSGDRPFDLAVDDIGGVYVTGIIAGQMHTLKLNASDRTLIWGSSFGGCGGNSGWGAKLAFGQDGSIYVTGASDSGNIGNDIVLVKYDAGTGSVAWQDCFDGPGGGHDWGADVQVSPNGNAAVVGTVYISGCCDSGWVTLLYDGSGALLDSEIYSPSPLQADQPRSLDIDEDNAIYVSGSIYGGINQGLNYSTIQYTYDPANNTLVPGWTATFDGGYGNDIAWANAVDSRCERVYVAGDVSKPGGGTNILTIAYDLVSGTPIRGWRNVVPDGAIGLPQWGRSPEAIRLDNAGNVYVAGGRPLADRPTWVVVKYQGVTGLPLWQWTAASGPWEAAMGLALDRSGHVLVTGFKSGFFTAKLAPPCLRCRYRKVAIALE